MQLHRSLYFAALVLLAQRGALAQTNGTSATASASSFDCPTMLENTRQALQLVAYSPETVQIVLSQQLPSFWASNARGRVHPVGIFADAEGTLEYFYALGIGDALRQPPNFVASSGETVVQNITEQYITCDDTNGKVFWSYIFATGTVQDDGSIKPQPNRFLPARAVFSFTLDSTICSYDMSLQRLGIFTGATENGSGYVTPSTMQEPINTASADGGWLSNFFIRTVLFGRVCDGIQQACTGDNQQYDSKRSCVNTFSKKTFGTWDNADQDTITCRLLHLRLVPVRPEVHCKHVGPDGGGKCTDKTMADLYDVDYLTCPST